MNLRKDASNGFSQGLMMDYDPMGTPNTALTNALNATFITYNGNEGALLNDLGNGRVESAYLPEGFIPLGTTSFGGIMYIVSYNPLNDTCQIGSFPSPERNFTEGEDNYGTFGLTLDMLTKISNDENQSNLYSSFLLVVPLLNKDGLEIQLTSGDKFALNIQNLLQYYGYLQDLYKNNEASNLDPCIKLVLGIKRDGLLRELSDLLKYNTVINKSDVYSYISLTGDCTDSGAIKRIDDYRDLIESPYNIVNCNISGTLCLIVKIVTLDSFDESHKILLQ